MLSLHLRSRISPLPTRATAAATAAASPPTRIPLAAASICLPTCRCPAPLPRFPAVPGSSPPVRSLHAVAAPAPAAGPAAAGRSVGASPSPSSSVRRAAVRQRWTHTHTTLRRAFGSNAQSNAQARSTSEQADSLKEGRVSDAAAAAVVAAGGPDLASPSEHPFSKDTPAAASSSSSSSDQQSPPAATAAAAASAASSSDPAPPPPPPPVPAPRKWTYKHWEGDIDLHSLRSQSDILAEQAAKQDLDDVIGGAVASGSRRKKGAKKKSKLSVLQKGQRMLTATGEYARAAWNDPSLIRQWSADGWVSLKQGARHYWLGTKLLWAEVCTAVRLLRKLAGARASKIGMKNPSDASSDASGGDGNGGNGGGSGAGGGGELTWRERRQLRRTLADLARVGPFLIILLIPFMELALPLLLKAFPGFLPSTFESKPKREARLARETEVRLEIAELLQEAVAKIARKQVEKGTAARKKEEANAPSTAPSSSGSSSSNPSDAAHLLELLSEVRHGRRVSSAEMARLSHLFEDFITLDRMGRKQLVRLARFFGLIPYASDGVLRFQLSRKIKQLREDDQFLLPQIDGLRRSELRLACHERGIRSVGMTEEGYRRALKSWLDLSLKYKVPDSLLLLSRPIGLLETRPSKSAIRAALLKLDQDVLDEIVPVHGEDEKFRDTEDRLALLKLENARIKEEEEQQRDAERQAAAEKLAHRHESPFSEAPPKEPAEGTAQADAATSPAAEASASAAASAPSPTSPPTSPSPADLQSLGAQLLALVYADFSRTQSLREKARSLRQKRAERKREKEREQKAKAAAAELAKKEDGGDEETNSCAVADRPTSAAAASGTDRADVATPAKSLDAAPGAVDADSAVVDADAEEEAEEDDDSAPSFSAQLMASFLDSKVERLLRDIDARIAAADAEAKQHAEEEHAQESSDEKEGASKETTAVGDNGSSDASATKSSSSSSSAPSAPSDATLIRWISRTLASRVGGTESVKLSPSECAQLLQVLKSMCAHEGIPLTTQTLARMTRMPAEVEEAEAEEQEQEQEQEHDASQAEEEKDKKEKEESSSKTTETK